MLDILPKQVKAAELRVQPAKKKPSLHVCGWMDAFALCKDLATAKNNLVHRRLGISTRLRNRNPSLSRTSMLPRVRTVAPTRITSHRRQLNNLNPKSTTTGMNMLSTTILSLFPFTFTITIPAPTAIGTATTFLLVLLLLLPLHLITITGTVDIAIATVAAATSTCSTGIGIAIVTTCYYCTFTITIAIALSLSVNATVAIPCPISVHIRSCACSSTIV